MCRPRSTSSRGETLGILGCELALNFGLVGLRLVEQLIDGNAADFRPSSFSAAVNSSRLGALPCQPGWFSIKLTPLPLTVSARMTVGMPLGIRGLSNASTTLIMSWPLIAQTTCQPKLVYLSASGSTFITSLTQPSICRRLQSMTATMLSRW
jgi:hypothetical protein